MVVGCGDCERGAWQRSGAGEQHCVIPTCTCSIDTQHVSYHSMLQVASLPRPTPPHVTQAD